MNEFRELKIKFRRGLIHRIAIVVYVLPLVLVYTVLRMAFAVLATVFEFAGHFTSVVFVWLVRWTFDVSADVPVYAVENTGDGVVKG